MSALFIYSFIGSRKFNMADPVKTHQLGADLVKLRVRILARRMDPVLAKEAAFDDNALTPEEHRDVYKELRRLYQLNLNEEGNLGTLEDPALIARMGEARLLLAEHERAEASRVHRLDAIRSEFVKVMRDLTSLLRSLEERHKSERGNVELGHHLGYALADLEKGRRAHGYPSLSLKTRENPEVRSLTGLVVTKSKATAAAFEKFVEFIEGAHQGLFVMRREFEALFESLISALNAAEEDNQRLRLTLLSSAVNLDKIMSSGVPPGGKEEGVFPAEEGGDAFPGGEEEKGSPAGALLGGKEEGSPGEGAALLGGEKEEGSPGEGAALLGGEKEDGSPGEGAALLLGGGKEEGSPGEGAALLLGGGKEEGSLKNEDDVALLGSGKEEGSPAEKEGDTQGSLKNEEEDTA
jgi:hypothetical protein